MNLLKNNPILRPAIGLLVITLVIKVLGYAEKLLLAHKFGTAGVADAYMLVITIVLAFFYFFREVIEPGVLNGFMRSKPDHAWGMFNFVLRIVGVLSVLIAIAGVVFPEQIIDL